MNTHFPAVSKEELERAIEASGIVNGEPHHMAAIAPSSVCIPPKGRYPMHMLLPDETPVQWVEVWNNGLLETIVSWSGDPMQTLEVDSIIEAYFPADDPEDRFPSALTAIGAAGTPIETARDMMLEKFSDHGPVISGTVYEFNEASRNNFQATKEMCRKVRDGHPEIKTYEQFRAWQEAQSS